MDETMNYKSKLRDIFNIGQGVYVENHLDWDPGQSLGSKSDFGAGPPAMLDVIFKDYHEATHENAMGAIRWFDEQRMTNFAAHVEFDAISRHRVSYQLPDNEPNDVEWFKESSDDDQIYDSFYNEHGNIKIFSIWIAAAGI
jgi:hypothetical protein